MPTPKKDTKKKATTAITKKKSTKIVAVEDGITLNCLDKQTVVPKDSATLVDNVGRFARKCGMGNYSVYSSSSASASAMNESQIRDYSGTELWVTERNKASHR